MSLGDKHTILIIEDEKTFADMMKLRFEIAGYDVLTATDTPSGVDAVLKYKPDLIVLDLMMPGGGGFSVLQQIKRHPDKSKIPVVIVTGKTIDAEVKSMIGAFRVAALFTKPYDPQAFLETIQSLIRN